jgi:hypothetical protein
MKKEGASSSPFSLREGREEREEEACISFHLHPKLAK